MAVTISPETYGEMNVNDLASAQNLLVVEGNGVVSKRNAARGSNPYTVAIITERGRAGNKTDLRKTFAVCVYRPRMKNVIRTE